MSLLTIVVISAVCLLAAYYSYGPLLARLLRLRADVPTPAVDIDRCTSDIAALLRHQEAGEIGKFLGLACTADWDLLCVRLVVLLDRHIGPCCQLHMLIGTDEADEQSIDQHVVRCQLVRQRLGHCHACRARYRSRHAVRSRRFGSDVEDVDDAAPASFLHLRRDQPNQSHRS